MDNHDKNSKIEFIEKLKKRTKQIGLDAIQLFRGLPKVDEARIVSSFFDHHFLLALITEQFVEQDQRQNISPN